MPQEEDLAPPHPLSSLQKKTLGSILHIQREGIEQNPEKAERRWVGENRRPTKQGLLLEHKGGECVSPNTKEKGKIMKILKKHYPDYYF